MQILDYDGLKIFSNNINNLSNPNILINSNFKINQRDGYIVKPGSVAYVDKECTNAVVNNNMFQGYPVENIYDNYATLYTKQAENNFIIYCKLDDIEKGYSGNDIYTVDRWKFNNMKDANILNIHDQYITLVSNDDNEYSQIYQHVANYKDYIGKTLTLSVKLRVPLNTKAYIQLNCGTDNIFKEIINTNNEWKIVTTKLLVNETANRLYAGIGIFKKSSGSVDIEWAKLEVGDIATPYIPPDPTIELLKCKYYYQEIYTNTRLAVMNSNLLIGNMYMHIPMRTTPTIKFKNNRFNENYCAYIINGNIIDEFSFEPIFDAITDTIHIYATKNSHGLNELNTLLVVGKKNPICLSAEI